MIRGLKIKNFSLLKEFRLGVREEEILRAHGLDDRNELGSLLGLIGRNSSGKSTIFECLAFLRDVVTYSLPQAASMSGRGGYFSLISESADPEDSMAIQVVLEKSEQDYFIYSIAFNTSERKRPYILSESLRRARWTKSKLEQHTLFILDNRKLEYLNRSGETSVLNLTDSKETALSHFGRFADYPDIAWVFWNLTHIYVHRLSSGKKETSLLEEGGHKHLKEDEDNLANVLLYRETQDPESYFQWLNHILDKIHGVKERGQKFSVGKMSTGERKLFEMLVLMENEYSLICFDEPDVSLYYQMMEELLKEMRDYTFRYENSQIFFTTHNSNLLQGLQPDEVWMLERESGDNVRAVAVGHDPVVKAMYAEGLDMGMLWYGGYLGDK